MPEEKTVDAVTPEADVTEVKQEVNQTPTPEEIQKKLERLEFLERESKEAFKQRDEAKKKLKEQEDIKEKEKLEALQKAGKYEELNQELLRKQTEMEQERSELLTFKEKYTIFEQQVKQDLLNKLPEAKRKFVQGFTIEDLREYVALEEASNPTKVGTADAGRPGHNGNIDPSKVTPETYLKMSAEQRESFAKQYPTKYREIFLQMNQKRKI